MKIFNVRLGLANNSSSTHSIVFLKEPGQDKDAYGSDFGWDFFTAASEDAKKDYLALTLYYNLQRMCSNEMAATIVREWVGTSFPLETESWDGTKGPDGYIDHQSIMTFPNEWDGKGIDKRFVDEFKKYLLLPNVAVLGGNDNTEESHPLLRGATKWATDLPLDDCCGNGASDYVARKDPNHDYWVLFNRKFGTKVRFSFDPNAKVPEKSYAPELVDIKITDFCPFGCTYCYQDSTLEGKHADSNVLRTLARALGGLKVFEVALGGGEPTLYPDFIGLLQTFREYGVVPNFTTKSLHWLRDPNLRVPILESCGSFAYSASCAHEVWDLLALLNEYCVDTGKVSVQTVLGVAYGYELDRIFELCATSGLQLTLLGFKTTGRGKSYDTKDWRKYALDTIKRCREQGKCPRLAVDTLAATQLLPELKQLKIPDWLYHTQEGRFSCYIDATKGAIAPSSYCDEGDYQKIGLLDTPEGRLGYDTESLQSQIAVLYSRF
jgi:MoaA/NifB/PqqE/SkfB family radical SAM enzyme